MEYKKVTIYNDSEDNFLKAVAETTLGTLEITNEDSLVLLLQAFANQESVELDNLLSNEKLINKKIIAKEMDEERSTAEMTLDDEVTRAVFDVERRKTKKNRFGIIKRLIAYASAAAILITGVIHLDRHKFDGKIANFIRTGKIDNQIDNEKSNGTITVVSSGSGFGSEYDRVMSGVMDRHDENANIVSQLTTKTVVEFTHEEILSALNDNTRIANSSIFEVSQFINGHGLSGNAYYNNFENIFDVNSADYYAVKLFSDMRNDVLRLVFEEHDIEGAKSVIRDFYSVYTELAILGNNCLLQVDGKNVTIGFDDLSDMGKATILDLGIALFTVNLDYNYFNGNNVLTKVDILDSSIQMLEGELVPRLINKGYSK